MAREDVGNALKAMDDDKVREQIAGGGLEGLDFDLTDDERDLVIGAAEDYPEVTGFGTLPWQAPGQQSISPQLVGQLQATGRFGKAAAYAFGPSFDQNLGHIAM